jgi:hypothetical protein
MHFFITLFDKFALTYVYKNIDIPNQHTITSSNILQIEMVYTCYINDTKCILVYNLWKYHAKAIEKLT